MNTRSCCCSGGVGACGAATTCGGWGGGGGCCCCCWMCWWIIWPGRGIISWRMPPEGIGCARIITGRCDWFVGLFCMVHCFVHEYLVVLYRLTNDVYQYSVYAKKRNQNLHCNYLPNRINLKIILSWRSITYLNVAPFPMRRIINPMWMIVQGADHLWIDRRINALLLLRWGHFNLRRPCPFTRRFWWFIMRVYMMRRWRRLEWGAMHDFWRELAVVGVVALHAIDLIQIGPGRG